MGGALPMTDTMDAEFLPEARLSQLQKKILRCVYARTIRDETWAKGTGETWRIKHVEYWGIEWYPSKGQRAWTPSNRAVMSRALRRLEQRGLVERRNRISGEESGRTVNVHLTDRGREVAKRLTSMTG
jgi:hypothetical protein